MRRTRVIALLSAILLAACGTGEDGGNSSNGGIVTSNNGTDGGASDGSVTTPNVNNSGGNSSFNEGCDLVECNPGERCIRGACVPSTVNVACEQLEDLGTLNPSSDILLAAGDTSDFVDSVKTDCGSIGPVSGAEYGFTFSVSSPATLNLSLATEAAVDWVMEVRRDTCLDDDAVVICSDPETTSFAVEPGIDFLLVEPAASINKGPFEVTGEFSAGACAPAGSLSCTSNSEIGLCFGGEEVRPQSCAGACANDACAGNSCAEPLEVTASTTLSGDVRGYTDDFDFDNAASCSPGGEDGIAGPGNDLVLSFPGLSAGQTVVVDASSDSVDHALYLLSGCGATTCDAAVDLGDRLEFTTESAGTYFVVVDVASSISNRGTFQIDVEVQ